MDLTRVDGSAKYKLGTKYIREDGQPFKYVKIDFGMLGRIKKGRLKGKIPRDVKYMWFPVPV